MGLNLYKFLKIFILNLQDLIIVIFSVYATYLLRFDQALNVSEIPIFIYLFPGLIFLIIFNFSNFYYSLTRYFSVNTIINFLKSFFLYFIAILLSVIFLNENEINFVNISTRFSENIPKSFVIIQPLILFFLIILNRFLIFNLVNILKKNQTNLNYTKKKVIVYGAGDLGLQTLNFLEKFKKNFEVVNFIDDNIYLSNQYIQNIKIINFNIFENEKIYKNIDTIYVSFSFNEEKRRKKLLINYQNIKLKLNLISILMGILDTNFLVDNKIDINDIVYSRDYSSKINEIKNHYIKKILITGAAGSIGLNLSKRLTTMKLDTIYLVDNNEYNLFKLKSELNKQILNCKVKYLLLDISEDYGIKELTKITDCDFIIHVAAYKHVDILETNIASAIKNNIFSTYKLCNIAKKIGAKNFYKLALTKQLSLKI